MCYCCLMYYQCCSFQKFITQFFIFVMILVNNKSHFWAVCLIGQGFVFSYIIRILQQGQLQLLK